VLLAAAPAVGWGDEIKLTPMVAVKEEYNDNLFFSSTNKASDYITTLSPGLMMQSNTERLKTAFSARIDQRLYLDYTNLDATDQFYTGNVSYAFTPKLSLVANAGYSQDSSPDRDIETTGLVLSAVRRIRQNYGLSGDYAFSEKTQATLSGQYSQDRYAEFANKSINDLDSGTGNLMVTHDISTLLPSTKARFGLGYANYQYVNANSTIDNYTGTVGLSRPFNEVWTASVDVGCRYTTSQNEITSLQFVPPFSFEPVTRTENTTGWGAVGNAVVSYKGEKTTVDFSLSHDIMPAYGFSGATERTALGLNMSRKFTQELSGTFEGGYILNNSTQGESSSSRQLDQNTVYVRPGIRYEINADMAVDATYTYTRTDYHENTDYAADRNMVMVRFYYQYPLFE
jgi:hypothetical protein